jgi:DnaJ-domain-containing protein 1
MSDEISRKVMEIDDFKLRLDNAQSQIEILRKQKASLSTPSTPTPPVITEDDLRMEFERGKRSAEESLRGNIGDAKARAEAALAQLASRPKSDPDDLKKEFERGKTEAAQEWKSRLVQQEQVIESLKKELQSVQDKAAETDNSNRSGNAKLLDEAKVELLSTVVQTAAELLSSQPEDQTYSGKDVIRLIKTCAKRALS